MDTRITLDAADLLHQDLEYAARIVNRPLVDPSGRRESWPFGEKIVDLVDVRRVREYTPAQAKFARVVVEMADRFGATAAKRSWTSGAVAAYDDTVAELAAAMTQYVADNAHQGVTMSGTLRELRSAPSAKGFYTLSHWMAAVAFAIDGDSRRGEPAADAS